VLRDPPVEVANPLREAMVRGRFCYVVELVARSMAPQFRLFGVGSQLARVPGLVAASITNYAGGAPGHDPVRIGAAVRARGLEPNIHLTCVYQDRASLRRTLQDLRALGIANVFAMTGDYPRGTPPDRPAPVFDLDAVQLVALIDELRRAGAPFWIGVAVSPFKYDEADCVWQYLKLEKKVAAGADYAITQVGYDARKFRELRRYLDERRIGIPVLGNVYVLTVEAAERMARGEPPGCWVAPGLLERVRHEARAPDHGVGARLERAARTVAVLRGLGYAGAYLGGTNNPRLLSWIIERAEVLAPRWEEFVDDLSYAPPDGFYLDDGRRRPPPRREIGPRVLDLASRAYAAGRGLGLRRLLRRAFGWLDRRPRLAKAVERIEMAVKAPVFGCVACGNCVLSWMEYVCPQTCPKQMRNGPCGGTLRGRCEVVEAPCIWVGVYERARASGGLERLRAYVPPPDRSLAGTSSWINYFLERDSRPGRPRPVGPAEEGAARVEESGGP
jgi:methylenetetrahydrofolate reductase (NADPH)